MDLFDFSTLLPLIIAVIVFLRLRSVLGTRTGHEGKPPYEPYRRDSQDRSTAEADDMGDVSNDNVVTLPSAKTNDTTVAEGLALERINALASPRTKLNKALKSILAADPSFDPEQFIGGAKMAYEMIVTSFADGDKRALKSLLSKEVYEGFAGAIDDRNTRGESIDQSFVGIEGAKVVGATHQDNEAQVTVRFTSQLISSTRNEEGEVVDGDPNEVAEVVDVWTFARDTNSSDPNWRLVATEADG